jgi:hypothetical protein
VCSREGAARLPGPQARRELGSATASQVPRPPPSPGGSPNPARTRLRRRSGRRRCCHSLGVGAPGPFVIFTDSLAADLWDGAPDPDVGAAPSGTRDGPRHVPEQ